jgi:hypothetical protein
MDMSGAMPRAAWFEIRDASGALLTKVSGHIAGGGISAELPAFPPGTLGTIALCADFDGEIDCETESVLEELPTNGQSIIVAQIG